MLQIMESETLDMSAILMQAYDMGDMINSSAEVADYLYWKTAVRAAEVKDLKAVFARKKDASRNASVGHYHPSYHDALAL